MVSVIYEHLSARATVVAVWAICSGVSGCTTAYGVVRPSPFPGSVSRADRVPAVIPRRLVERALALSGTSYRLGGEDPATGLDCSGLVRHVFLSEGLTVPRTVAEQFNIGLTVNRSDLRPGDLVFFDTTEPGPSHVGIAIDSETFVHAPGSGGVVRVERLTARYWQDRLRGIRRIAVRGPVRAREAYLVATSR
jgi:cell wall-associated NlpC family hydrolase